MASTRLLKTERSNNQESLPPSTNPRNNRQSTQRMTFHKVGRLVGIQQCMNQGRGRRKSSVQNESRVI